MRHILSSKDGTHRASHAFLDFLGAPPLPASTRNATAASSSSTAYSSSVPPPPTTFTSPAWLSEHANLLTLSRSIRSSLSKRDTLLGSGNTSGGHIAGIQAKRELQELVSRVGALALGLEEISKRERLGDGEMRRRNDLVAKLQDECVGLGKQAATARRAAVAQERSDATTGSSFFHDAPPTAQRAALLGLGGGGGGGGGGAGEVRTVRTFGAPPPGRETDETRALDAGGLMHLQQTRINEQDTMLGQLSVRPGFSRETVALLTLLFFSLFRPSSSGSESSARPLGRRLQNKMSCSISSTRRSTRREPRWARRSGRW